MATLIHTPRRPMGPSYYPTPTRFPTDENLRSPSSSSSSSSSSPFPLPGSRKALPTVSLTNAVASCVGACAVMATDVDMAPTKNVIPFPTSDEPECVSLLVSPCPRIRPRASQVELRHRRSKARLAQSPLARKDAPRGRSKSPDVAARPGRRVHGSGADAQLLATVYRTVTNHLGEPFGELGCVRTPREVMEAQERLLVQRLSESMVELGCSPFPIAAKNPRTLESFVPLAGCMRQSSPPPPPPTCAMPHDPPVLTMPQLVAKLLLRHGERARRRASSRGRPPEGDRPADVPVARRSPLAISVDV